MLEKLKTWFHKSYFGCLYLNFLLWRENKRQERAILAERYSNMFHMPQIVKNNLQISYEQGIRNLKRKLHSILVARDTQDLKEVLESTDNLIPLAQGEDEEKKEEFIQNLREVYIYKEKDIKTDTDKAKMIETRIQHFEELKKDKEKRELSKKIRHLEQAGDTKQVNKLMKKWKENYGKSKNRL